MKIISKRHGFTLIELMIALAMSGIVAMAMYAAYTGLQRINHDQALIVETQQNLRAGIDMMARELRMAGYDPDKDKGAGFTEATSKTVAFTMFNEDTGAIETIKYYVNIGYSDGTDDVLRQVNGGTPVVLIENVSSQHIEFLYILSDGTQVPVLNPVTKQLSTDPLTAAQLSQIRSVQISVLARASGISLKYRNNETYRPASYDPVANAPLWTVNPPDNFRRRLQIVRVNCRNMGW